MNSELIRKASQFATHSSFNGKIHKFGISSRHDVGQRECDNVHDDYKKVCNFDKILKFDYLFKNHFELYHDLKYKVKYLKDEVEFRNVVNGFQELVPLFLGKSQQSIVK